MQHKLGAFAEMLNCQKRTQTDLMTTICLQHGVDGVMMKGRIV
jgi:hypothetical protein